MLINVHPHLTQSWLQVIFAVCFIDHYNLYIIDVKMKKKKNGKKKKKIMLKEKSMVKNEKKEKKKRSEKMK